MSYSEVLWRQYKRQGKQSVDPFAKPLFYSGVGVSVFYETESFWNVMKSCKYILFSLQDVSYVACESAVYVLTKIKLLAWFK